ncbi:MAG: hypothetical protein KIS78_06560 [Labilithrix sp.]|nr:hypothetical protein [Labilithrix sp.]MCW5832099.1 hypothetical protein [Labilithrix sp.]
MGCVAWSVRTLGCDTSATNSAFVDTDGDGISDVDESHIYGTSPLLADTDGDGMSDYDEIVLHAFDPTNAPLRFNPRVADVPLMNVRIVGPPLISLRLTATSGETWTYETAQTIEEGVILSMSVTQEESFASTFGESETISEEITVEFGPTSLVLQEDLAAAEEEDDPAALVPPPIGFWGPGAVIVTSGVSATIDWSNTVGVTLSFTAQQARELRQALTFAQSYAQSHELSASGAIMEVLVEFENRGNIPFRVTNMVLAATFVGPDGVESPVGNLDINTLFNNFVPYSLAPGEVQGPVNFSRDFLTLDQVSVLAADFDGLNVRVGVYEIVDGDNRPFVFDVATMMSRTATLIIDYGEARPPERYLVATNLDPARPGVTAERALFEILRIPYEADAERGLTSVRDVASEEGRWSVQHRYNEAGEPATLAYEPPYELAEILLRAGDVLVLTWSEP